jgi:hypothetical protein
MPLFHKEECIVITERFLSDKIIHLLIDFYVDVLSLAPDASFFSSRLSRKSIFISLSTPLLLLNIKKSGIFIH